MRLNEPKEYAMTQGNQTRKVAMIIGLAGVFLFGAAGLFDLEAQAIKSDSEVKVAAKADKPTADGKQKITVTLTINKGWYIYANPVDNEDFESAKTVVKIGGNKKVEELKIAYPAGIVKKEAAPIGNLKVYKKQVSIPVTVQWAGQPEALEISVRFMACNEEKGQCLLPATVKVKVP
jgi:DsbC/DsbD-like thiol-disulfide interchange protein